MSLKTIQNLANYLLIKGIHTIFGFQKFLTLALPAEIIMMWWWVKWRWGGHNVVPVVITIVNMVVGPHLAWQITFQFVSDEPFQHGFWSPASHCRVWLGQRVEPCVIQNRGGPTVTPQKQSHYLFRSSPCPKLTSLTVSVQSI